MFERAHLQVLRRRLKEPRRWIQVLAGPRQVGKTTLILQLTSQYKAPHLFVSADAVAASDTVWLQQQWQLARTRQDLLEAEEFLLIIDEIQKIENWSEMVKKMWDEDTNAGRILKLILLGSSRLLLQNGLTESLAGRFETIYMGHWSGKEMQTAFGWSAEQYAWFGGYPASGTLIQEEERWKAYVRDSLIETSISKDILMMSRIDKPALMRRLFELGCVYSGQILSLTKLIGQLQDRGNTTTLSHYLDILNTAGLLCGIEKFTPDLARQRASSPKFQVHNTALISAQRHESFSEISSKPEEWGRIVESAVGAHLLNQSITSNCTLYYWRDRNDEVDFIIEKGDKIMAIEVKSGLNQSKKGMDTFARKYQPYKVLLVGQSGIPWQEFLQLDLLEIFR
jgi:uncharacterized protein